MGVYPQRHIESIETTSNGAQSWVEIEKEPGIVRRRHVYATSWQTFRVDCYCCSCPDWGGPDPYCRNHGFAAERPCEVHNMPGTADEKGVMPESVQAERARNRESRV